MRKTLLACIAAFALAAPAAAHEVWIERDGEGPARIYLGEPAEPIPEGGDPEFPKLKAPRLLGWSGALVRRADHLEAPVAARGDLRLVDEAIFAPWKNAAGAHEGAIFYAREGRSETREQLDLEIVPVTADGDRFAVLYKGKPLAGASVTLRNPERWSKSFKAGTDGVVALPVQAAGRYIAAVTHATDETRSLGGQIVAKVHHVSTLTFVAR